MSRVVVAMSGGVDSSVVAALLKQQGFDVVGMMMRLWSEPGTENENRCCTPDAIAQARRVAGLLGIPFYTIDAQKIFLDRIVQYFIDGYTQGTTPNPCLVCNRYIRWEFLLEQALAIGAEFMATGHYVRLGHDQQDRITLNRAVDINKDQSYVLYMLTQTQLRYALFPLGDFTKTQVRQMARDFGLPVAERPESQDLCFLGNEDYRSFLKRNVPISNTPGLILDRQGNQYGKHDGLAFYTIGQRKGLGIPSPMPLYVLDKIPATNTLIIGTQYELGNNELVAVNVNWVSGECLAEPRELSIKIRYKADFASGIVSPLENNQVHIRFNNMLRDITPGQAAVFYDQDTVVGGGLIRGVGYNPAN